MNKAAIKQDVLRSMARTSSPCSRWQHYLMRYAVGRVGRALDNRAFIIGTKEERGAPMSLGYAGHARLEAEDDEIAIYSYTGENWNVRDEDTRNALVSEEGQFTISKSCLIELAMHRKVKRLPNGRKGHVEKAIVRHPDFAGMMDRGDIVVDRLCGVDAKTSGYHPCIYRCLLRHIFESYQLNGRLPEKEGFVV